MRRRIYRFHVLISNHLDSPGAISPYSMSRSFVHCSMKLALHKFGLIFETLDSQVKENGRSKHSFFTSLSILNIKFFKIVMDYISRCKKDGNSWLIALNELSRLGEINIIKQIFDYMKRENIEINSRHKKTYLETCLTLKNSKLATDFITEELNNSQHKVEANLIKVSLLTCAATGTAILMSDMSTNFQHQAIMKVHKNYSVYRKNIKFRSTSEHLTTPSLIATLQVTIWMVHWTR